MSRELFMAKRDIIDAQPVARIDERVVGVPALPKYFCDAFVLQALRDEHCPSHLFRFS
jgi:hypothetical protein